jgi:Domain of Unknown Function with PDB structure (DUF3857)
VRLHLHFSPLLRAIACSCLLLSVIFSFSHAKQAPEKPAEKKPEKAALPEKSENPAQIELLETRYRFEANGDSRKEVHTRVHINNELGVRQFARLNFDYNRSFESIEIPLVHITHPSGGTADILPSAITDNPNPAVINAPAYQDVRVKSVRILGLEPGDTLEYRIITTTTHHPLAPDFWLDHSFDRSGIVSHEIFELDLPASIFEETPAQEFEPSEGDPAGIAPVGVPVAPRAIPPRGQIHVSSETPETSHERFIANGNTRLVYKWIREPLPTKEPSPRVQDVAQADVVVTTETWGGLAHRLSYLLYPYGRPTGIASQAETVRKYGQIFSAHESDAISVYRLVAQKIRTVDLPVGATGFRLRSPSEVLSSGYATAEEKAALFLALLPRQYPRCDFAFFSDTQIAPAQLARPSLLNNILVVLGKGDQRVFLDPALEVAPFGVIPSELRGKMMLMIEDPGFGRMGGIIGYFGSEVEIAKTPEVPSVWQRSTTDLPFSAAQYVNIDATIAANGALSARVQYRMRGDNELLLRVAFHQSPKDKWKNLAQLLSISDGFRGQVTTVTASDPYATKEPFTVEYEITEPKFVDWSKKPVRIPALLPQLGLPDAPAKPAPGAPPSPVELGTPLEVETHMTLHLPPGTTVAPPTGTSIQRDYATFSSQYSVKGPTVSASRHINFLLRQVPADRAADYNAFLHAVQSDQAQLFTLDRESPPAPASKPAATTLVPPPNPNP